MSNQTPLDGAEEAQTASESDSSFADILNQFEQSHVKQSEPGAGGREATVIAISGDSVFFDVGMKIEGAMPVADFRDAAGNLTIKPGDKVQVAITGRNEEGYYQLSRLKIARPKDFSSLQKAFEEKRTIAGVVTGVVKGGLTVDIGMRAFMPASRSGAKDPAEMQNLIG